MVIEGNSRKNVLERQQTAVRDTCSRKRPDDFSQQLGPRPRSWPIMTLSSLNCFGGRTTKRTRRRARSASLDLLCSAEDREPGHQSIFYTQLTSPLDTLLRPHGVEEEGEAAVLIRNSLNTLQQSRPPRGSNLSNEPGDRVGTAQSDSDESGYRVGSAQSDSSNKEGVCLGVALCDNNPSPYDREGLPFRAGDRIQILAMNPSGLWRGRVHGREGIFKFIRVKLLDGEPRRKLSVGWEEGGNRSAPSYLSLGLVLANAGLAHLAPKLILNGYESVADLLELTREDLGYLDITDEEHGSCCASAVSLLDRLTASSRSVDNIDDCQNGIGGTSDQSESDLKSRDTARSLASKTSSEDDLAGDKNSSAAPSLLAKDGVSQWPWQESFLFRHLQQTVTIRL